MAMNESNTLQNVANPRLDDAEIAALKTIGTMRQLRAGEFTGDIDILSRRRPVVSAVARGDTQVLHVPSTDIRHIIVERPALGERILKAFIARRDQLLESGFQA